jgi:hypothetical protein
MRNNERMLLKPLRYVFYRAFLWQQGKQATDGFAANVALVYVSFLLMFWSLAIVTAISDILRLPVNPSDKGSEVIFAMSCGLMFYLFPYVAFVRGGRYKKIIAEFSKHPETQIQLRIREAIIFASYIVAWLLITFLAVLHQYI